jgi:SagB-type dehydrogenase family enzyme
VSQRVDGLADGVHHYDARAHQLEERRRGRFHAQIANMTLGQAMVADANLVIVVTAVFQRTMWKYGQRGYRYVWLEAGHLGQSIYLAAHAMHLGAVAIGGFFEREVDACIGVSGTDETAVYMLCVGVPAENRP